MHKSILRCFLNSCGSENHYRFQIFYIEIFFKGLFFLGRGAFLTLSIGIPQKIHIICTKLTVRTAAESHIASVWVGGRYPLLPLAFTKLDNVHKVCYGHEYSDKLMGCNPHCHCVTGRHLSNSVIREGFERYTLRYGGRKVYS